MEHLPNPINVEKFVAYFRAAHKEISDTTFTGFRQTETRWRATFQDTDACIEFQGRVDTIRRYMEEHRYRN